MSEPYSGKERRDDNQFRQCPGYDSGQRALFDIETLQRGQDEIRTTIWGEPGGVSLREEFTAGITEIRTLLIERFAIQDRRITKNETLLKLLGMAGAAALTLGGIGLTIIQMIVK